MLNKTQILELATSIDIVDVVDYIKKNAKGYEEFLKSKDKRKEVEDCEELRRIEKAINLGKLELSIVQR